MQRMLTMASAGKVTVDIISDTVCPWCFVGKRRLEKAMKSFDGQKQFEVRWHPFFLNPNAPQEGVNKLQYYQDKFGESRTKQMIPAMTETFAKEGVDGYNMDGLTGNTLNSHRLIWFAGQHSPDTQDKVVEQLFRAYFTQGKYVNDPEILLEAATAAGLPEDEARAFIADESRGREEVLMEVVQPLAPGVSGVPHFVINGKYSVGGAQDPEVFKKVFSKV